ncbi:unnamed protein product [Lactuca saligna]|uniref:non-specific serine/threonine protein kinase n=1 Tax=Lactuca saligna TaxID=75948 RepID=A0AA35YGU6_LACSI|nr:unnamed protein product [Lactuca saligna]
MNSRIAFLFSTLVIFLISASIYEIDYQALLQFKSMIMNEEVLSSCNTSFHFCDWSGVLCGKQNKRVTALNNNFQGTIPHELGHLSRLCFLQFGYNKFNGVIPTNLSGCSNLEELELYANKLVRSIPKEISLGMSKRTEPAGTGNRLRPKSRTEPARRFYRFRFCRLTSGIPPVLKNITSMEQFSATRNPLGGSIPNTLGNWKILSEFYSGACNLSGTIAHSIFNLSLLTNFSLPVNQLTGSLPSAIGEMLPHLEFLQLRDDMKFIDTLKNCSRIKVLHLINCNFQGVLPTTIGNLSDQLSILSLDGNDIYIYGNLPSSIGNLVGLIGFSLTENQFTGKIPSTIGNLQKLQEAYLYNNQFSGPIPDAIGNLSLLTGLWLNSNKLEGHIPSILGNCHHLLELHLDDNKLSGKIPTPLLQLTSLTIILNLSQNNMSGSLPVEVGELKLLTSLDLSDNNLSGNIPSSIGGCTSLLLLFLKGNTFQGMVPTSLSSMKGVSTLDLLHNNLSGQIPRFSEQLTLLEYVNLSFNDFEGEVPVIGVFANARKFSVLGNSRLCGGLAQLGLPKCKETEKHQKRFPLFVILIPVASTLFTILCFAFVLSKKRKSHPSQSSGDERFMKVSYAQHLKATNGFSQANLIGDGGFGSVYKGVLDDHDGGIVAVKVLHLQNRGAHRSFIAECELHSSASNSRLSLLQRINILLDVASALDYLHNHCLPTLVHYDLKPSIILLDDDMVAHVGDFGLARFLGANSNKNSTSGIRGTIGYTPPEYGVGSEMTSSGDVYSFGILLLEVMTGKRPTDSIFNEGLSLHKFACMALPNHVTDVIDDDLLNFLQEDAIATKHTIANAKKMEECLASIIKLGVSCSVDSPPQRMNIENVVHELQHILNIL